MSWGTFLWTGLLVLSVSCGFCRDAQASAAIEGGQSESVSTAEQFVPTADPPATTNHPTKSNPDSLPDRGTPTLVSETRSRRSKSLSHRAYRVKKGDTLAKIARKTGVSLAELRKINQLKESRLRIGQRIELVRGQDEGAGEELELLKERADLEPAPHEGDAARAETGAGVGLNEQEDTAPSRQGNNTEEQRLLVKVAMRFLGTPYHLGGYSLKGIDCSGLVKKTYQFFNIELPRTVSGQALAGLIVRRSQLIVGDLLFFRTKRRVGHVGIYLGDNKFIHASSYGRDVRISSLNRPYFDKRFVRAVRVRTNNENS